MAIGSNKRLLLELDKYRNDVNKRIINSCLDDLDLDKLTPIVELVAKSRAAYVLELSKIAENPTDSGPSTEQIDSLRARRLVFSELVEATNALEVIIERGYVGVVESDSSSEAEA